MRMFRLFKMIGIFLHEIISLLYETLKNNSYKKARDCTLKKSRFSSFFLCCSSRQLIRGPPPFNF